MNESFISGQISTMVEKVDTSFIPDVPKGPLCVYRKRAKFDWKCLRLIFEEEKQLRLKYKIWKILENDLLFVKSKVTLTADEQKRIAAMQMNKIAHLIFPAPGGTNESYQAKTRFIMSGNEALHAVSPSLSIKIALGVGLFNNALLAMGSERHHKFYHAGWNKVVACIAITEVANGSNLKSIRTTATYDPEAREFIINTPDFEAAKCWVGNLGKTATISLTFANLITPDGVNHGVHGFIVPIRDPRTLLPYPRVVVGDIGEKIGLNGIDNGFLMFSNYRIPHENLLNRTSDVTEEGVYESVFSEPGKILGAALGSFSAGRIGIMQESIITLSHATVIAVRYAALRKQFGPEKDGPELPIIEYQLHQWRILPYLAAACVFKVSVNELTNTYLRIIERSQADSKGFELLSQAVSEIHAVVSSSKPLLSWTARDAIQEAREACGGHGYLKASNLGELRNNHDACCTYEGDNNVLGQQTTNWLLRQWEGKVESPAGTADFIHRKEELLRTKSEDVLKKNSVESMDFIISCYEWLLCYLLNKTSTEIKTAISNGLHKFDARNNSQVYSARDLWRGYAEYFALKSFRDRFQKMNVSIDLMDVLKLVYLIYGYWCLNNHMTAFYQGGFTNGPNFVDAIRKSLLRKCAELKDVAVSVADSLAPPDFVLNSVIGRSDGLLYQNLQNEFMTNPGAVERPSWWKDVLLPQSTSKL